MMTYTQREKQKITQKGFTLIEVMIAVVVFSFGLLGVAGVMTVSVKNNHNGYMRSQAAFLASSMIDNMRRNQIALWLNQYNGSYSGYSDISSLCTSTECLPKALADRDVQQWSNMITQILPNSSGSIDCVQSAPPVSSIPELDGSGSPCYYCAVEPYNGFCTVTVTWSESNELSANSTQNLSLVGKP